MIVAGEASGDKHGASLAGALTTLFPQTRFEFFGSGGDEMRAAGVETLVDARDVAIIGVPEIARALGRLYRSYRLLRDAARKRRPAAVVLIDWPDFNMRLARTLHREGFRIIYYVSPQVWAWRGYRIRALRRDIDRMLVILPFEEDFYKNAGVDVEYVGHPLAGAVRATASREEFCDRHRLDPRRAIVALLPGSRHKEVHYHLPLMLEAAVKLRNVQALAGESSGSFPVAPESLQFVIPLASTVARPGVEATVQRAARAAASKNAEFINVTIVERDTYNTLAQSMLAIVASGTATVEAALAGTPMVIIYRGSELNWRLIRPLIHLDTFGMVNLVAGRRIVPELIQHDATGDRIAAEAVAILGSETRRNEMKRDLARVSELLALDGKPGPVRAGLAIMNVIGTA